MSIKGSCKCGNICFTIKYLPREIAVCHCSICKSIHSQDTTEFIKCSITNIKLEMENISIFDMLFGTESNSFKIIKSSDVAKRIGCPKCDDIIFMYYYSSQNLWIVVSCLHANLDVIKRYHIYNS